MLCRVGCAQAEIVACVRQVRGATVTHTVERFATTTSGLVALTAWLQARGATHAVLEATGVYWKPVWHVLEGTVDLLLAHPASVKAIPGRKSDQHDAMWLADLLAHGLIRGSYVPPVAIQELRISRAPGNRWSASGVSMSCACRSAG